jgi:hypothetical protein
LVTRSPDDSGVREGKKMASEWAMEIAREDVGIFGGTSSSEPLIMAIAAELDAARAQGRREGLEKAARIVEDRDGFLVFSNDADKTVSRIAEILRARLREVKGE